MAFDEVPVQPVFKEAALNEQFRRDGVVGPLQVLDGDGADDLLRRLLPLVPTETPFYTMHREGDTPSLRRAIADVISEVLDPILSSQLDQYRLFLGGGVFFKHAHPDSRLGLHQDWTFVDEECQLSGSFWIPLVDSTRENGTFHCVMGSHRVEQTYRGSPLWPYVAEDVMTELEREYLTYFELRAGEALAFDHRLVHGSFPNLTQFSRPAIAVGFVPIGATIHHYYLAPDGRQYRYTVTDEFFQDYVIGDPPHGTHVLDCEEITVPIYRLDHDTVEAEFTPGPR